MNFNDPIFWSFVVTMCSIALLTEGALLVHVLFVTRQTLKVYLLLTGSIDREYLVLLLWHWYTSNKFEYLSLSYSFTF